MEWISVKNRLPEDNSSILIYGSATCDSCCSRPCVREGIYTEEDKAFTFGEYDCECETTHWMPLPEPPKEE